MIENTTTKESTGRVAPIDELSPESESKCEEYQADGFFIVINDKGLHTRPSTELVKCATSFKSQISLIHQGLVVNGKSLLGILTLCASRGSRITVIAKGEDADEAVETIVKLAYNKFYIHY